MITNETRFMRCLHAGFNLSRDWDRAVFYLMNSDKTKYSTGTTIDEVVDNLFNSYPEILNSDYIAICNGKDGF